ncbi:E3 ubiquitin-protein ligase TRIM39-like isoform X2 [Alligator sinensis]|uniref:RING-type E3 ubiquitin transferase n=1 Tax=Alligator sinensis TaxID=38654 RepID=A0A3Q0HPC4_ALLSI|nr:E3 ubiquitin-protein ligase TRIM39-like isoform X2 [Alligator sinensis]
MAAEDLALSSEYEVTCSICLGDFKDPVTIDCGHNFCRACISQCWKESQPTFSCPHCRETIQQRDFPPNKQLGNMVSLVKQLRSQEVREPELDRVCKRHQEALKLFCEEDQTLICMVCRESRAHRAHTVVPIEEAAQEYKEQIQTHLKRLRKEKEELLGCQCHEEKTSRELMMELERQLMVSECTRLSQLLTQEKCLLLARLGDLDKEIIRRKEENASRLREENACLGALITELEWKCQQPAPQFLQDVRSAVSRAEEATFQRPAFASFKMGKKVWRSPRESHGWRAPRELLDSFLLRASPWMGPKYAALVLFFALAVCFFMLQGTHPAKFANVSLDVDTANHRLILSADGKQVRLGYNDKDLPSNPRRFDFEPCVLGSEGFNSGRHYWIMQSIGGAGWAAGVARESVNRKSQLNLHTREGIWVVYEPVGDFRTHTSPENALPLNGSPKKIQVYLDYEGGQVAFYNAENKAPIFNFTASFSAEKIFPFFVLWDRRAEIKLHPPDME